MDDRKLQELYDLTKQNNAMLKSMHRANRISFWLKIVYYLIIFGIAAASYYYLQPIVDTFFDTISSFGAQNGGGPTINFAIPEEYRTLIENYLKSQGR